MRPSSLLQRVLADLLRGPLPTANDQGESLLLDRNRFHRKQV